jgi:hypothetical protein
MSTEIPKLTREYDSILSERGPGDGCIVCGTSSIPLMFRPTKLPDNTQLDDSLCNCRAASTVYSYNESADELTVVQHTAPPCGVWSLLACLPCFLCFCCSLCAQYTAVSKFNKKAHTVTQEISRTCPGCSCGINPVLYEGKTVMNDAEGVYTWVATAGPARQQMVETCKSSINLLSESTKGQEKVTQGESPLGNLIIVDRYIHNKSLSDVIQQFYSQTDEEAAAKFQAQGGNIQMSALAASTMGSAVKFSGGRNARANAMLQQQMALMQQRNSPNTNQSISPDQMHAFRGMSSQHQHQQQQPHPNANNKINVAATAPSAPGGDAEGQTLQFCSKCGRRQLTAAEAFCPTDGNQYHA